MPLTSGKMRVEHERKIRKNLIALKRDLDAKDLIDFFIQEFIFDFSDSDEINGYNPNTKENRNNCFFKLLFRSGEQAYGVFLAALRETQQDHLAELIENTHLPNNDQVPQGEPYSWIESIPQQVRQRQLAEKDLSRFAQTLGSDWEFLAMELGLSRVDVQHCQMENQTPVMQIYSALSKWRMRHYDRCTLDNLVKAMIETQSSVDWAQMRRIAEGMRP